MGPELLRSGKAADRQVTCGQRVKWIVDTMHLAVVLIISLALTARAGGASDPPDTILATVGNELMLTEQLLQEKLARLPDGVRADYESLAGQDQLLQELLRIEVFSREAAATGIDRDERVRAKIADITKAVLAQEYVTRSILARATVSEEEALQQYNRSPRDYTTQEKIKISRIYIPIPREGTDEATKILQAKADSAFERIRNGESFRAVAAELSVSPAQDDADYFGRGRFIPEIEDTVFSLAKGDVSPVLRAPGGFFIIKLEDRIPPTLLPFQEVREKVLDRLAQEKKLALFAQDEQRLFAKYNVVLTRAPGSEVDASPTAGTQAHALKGAILSIHQADASARIHGVLGTIHMRTAAGTSGEASQVVVTVTERTTIRMRSDSADTTASFDDLKPGQSIEAEVKQIKLSYPVQTQASSILIYPSYDQ